MVMDANVVSRNDSNLFPIIALIILMTPQNKKVFPEDKMSTY